MKIVFMGTPDFAVPSLQALSEDDDFDIVGVYTQPDKKRNRNRFSKTPVKVFSEEKGYPVFSPEKLNNRENWEILKNLNPDFIVVIAYGQIIGKTILNMFPNRIINIHGSLLPKYRGAAPIQRAVMNGDRFTGLTAMLIDREMDAGDMLNCIKVDIEPQENAAQLREKLSKTAPSLLLETLKQYDICLAQAQKQDENQVTYADKIEKEEAILDFNLSAEVLVNKVRGLIEWPVAKLIWNNEQYKIFKAHWERGEKSSTEDIGKVLQNQELLSVQTTDGIFIVDEIQAPNRKRMPIAEFLKGNSIPRGTKLQKTEI